MLRLYVPMICFAQTVACKSSPQILKKAILKRAIRPLAIYSAFL